MKKSMNLSLPIGFTLKQQVLASLENIFKVEDNNGDDKTTETTNSNDRPKVTKVRVPEKAHEIPPIRIQSNDRPKVTKVRVKRKGVGEVPFEYTVTLDFDADYPEGEYFIKVLMVSNDKYIEPSYTIVISGQSVTFTYPSETAVFDVPFGQYDFDVTTSQLGATGNPVSPETTLRVSGTFEEGESSRQSLWQRIVNFFLGKK